MMLNKYGLPDHLRDDLVQRIVARRRAAAAEQGEPDPYPDEVAQPAPKPGRKKKAG